MVSLTNGVTSKRPRTQKTSEENTNNGRMDDSGASSSHETDEEDIHQPPQESFADRLKILNINDGDQPQKNGLWIPANSLAQTLVQALNSADSRLLETCLLQTKKSLIANTIRRTPNSLIHNLIEQLIICLNKKKRGAGDGATVATVRRTKTLIEWIRQLLLIHMSYIITIPALVTKLTTLQSSLQKRLSLHTKLLSLNGRLELVLNKIEQNKSAANSALPNTISNGKRYMPVVPPTVRFGKKIKAEKARPAVKYVEGESTDEDEEVAEMLKSQEGSGGSEDGDGMTSDEGSIEEVVLGSEADSDSSDESSEEDLSQRKRSKNKHNLSEELFELEAELSGTDEDDEDEDEDDDEEEDDDDMGGFIDDGSGDVSDDDDDESD